MRRTMILCLLAALMAPVARAAERNPLDSEANPYAVPTFECLGLYWTVPGASGEAAVQYRADGKSDWQQGYPLWYDTRDRQFRGSLVGLAPGTEYEIRLSAGAQAATLQARTRSETLPVGRTTFLPHGVSDSTLVLRRSGTPEAWHLVTPSAGGKHLIDPEKSAEHNLVIEGSYIIVRGLELVGALNDAILIREGAHDIVIEDCRIADWGSGRLQLGSLPVDGENAIDCEEGVYGIVVQRNLIENPSYGSNDWSTGHPSGPHAVTFWNSMGGNVIRHNEIRSSEARGFNDAIGGGSNYSFEGSPNRDSDIYGNIISHVWDDAIESEGANMNVRIWGNYIHHTYTHIASAATSRGPLYIFRNVFGLARHLQDEPSGGVMLKMGEREPFKGGRRYVFHNTALQPAGAFRAFSTHPVTNTISRNNIFDCPGPLSGDRQPDPPADLDYDLFTGLSTGGPYERHGVSEKPAYLHSYGLEWYLAPTVHRIRWGRTHVEHNGQVEDFTDKVYLDRNPAIDAGRPCRASTRASRARVPTWERSSGAMIRCLSDEGPMARPGPRGNSTE